MRQSSIFLRKWYLTNSPRIGIIDLISIAAISGYQRYLSPYKGFRCAHRALHKGESCSQYVKRKVQQEGLISALRSSRMRFIECAEASQVMQSRRKDRSSEKPPERAEPDFLRGTKGMKKKAASAPKKCRPDRFDYCSCLENSCIVIAGTFIGGSGGR